jgi:hypothetical protein
MGMGHWVIRSVARSSIPSPLPITVRSTSTSNGRRGCNSRMPSTARVQHRCSARPDRRPASHPPPPLHASSRLRLTGAEPAGHLGALLAIEPAGRTGARSVPIGSGVVTLRHKISKLLPGSQRHGRAAVILAQSGRRGHDARISHRNWNGIWFAGRVGDPVAVCSLRKNLRQRCAES